ncbi:MAG: carbohydrate ABC transporter permease [Treponema sp.]|jgi:ABC-type glycerol-3-phosphate transport system permease component|nr:carbohydrate ABC transporter permease [Treponema sp.]
MLRNFRRLSFADKVFHAVCFGYLLLAGLMVAYPMLYIIACSFSSTDAIVQGKVFLWPVDFQFTPYKTVLTYPLLMSGFFNSIFYAAGSTAVAVSLLFLAAYPMSRKDMPGRKILLAFFIITMYFSGGMIPGYMLMRNLHLLGSRWVLVIGAGFSCYNMIIIRSYFQNSLPLGLLDAAHIDGCGDVAFFFRIALPLATPVIAVMVLFNVVGSWNSYFGGMLYLTKPDTFNFQMILRDILFVAQIPPEMVQTIDPERLAESYNLLQQIKYSVLVVGAAPMMVLYPFIQKYFIRGIMIGSLKE